MRSCFRAMPKDGGRTAFGICRRAVCKDAKLGRVRLHDPRLSADRQATPPQVMRSCSERTRGSAAGIEQGRCTTLAAP